MKLKKTLMLSCFVFSILTACTKDENELAKETDTTVTNIQNPNNSIENSELEIESFIFNGLNEIYLYKADIPELQEGYFESNNDRLEFLAEAGSPEELFDDLTSSQDRFSFITDDYRRLEDRFNGVSGATGIKFGIGRISGTNNVFGIIRYILPGTSAEAAGLKRGDIFTEINGQKLTSNNFASLIENSNFTINVGYVENNQIVLTDKNVQLSDENYTENPIYISKVLEVGNRKIGYLMYNSFIGNFDNELNDAFGDFKSAGVTDLILDLRYNGGGSVETATDLASMITGQFKGEVFIKEQWNAKYQSFYESQNPEALLNKFDDRIRTGAGINSLNLSEAYILTSSSSASASELMINGLDPYINVIQVGGQTVGKFQASVTLYDSENFGRAGASEEHQYAMQPLVFKSLNADGNTDYVNGLSPDVEYIEDLNDFGTLGEEDEPLLATALNKILGRAPLNKSTEKRLDFEILGETDMNQPYYQRMYIDELPGI
ncbi:S41 family peptidase [Christiangramia sabulilitoris]|uniref:Peptidase S41 n=1 Tax=Christiangramia sabulilitoris TaxID=2583991 RepID=A0A550HXL6_9FLAO|nr:S41 family peptidase [Christiangramia sabulilitoris]TRO63268.1 peptidase S41 [Christiangramia sabulilitoris]